MGADCDDRFTSRRVETLERWPLEGAAALPRRRAAARARQ